MEKKIPNLLTFANLFCGFIGIWAVANNDLVLAAYLILAGVAFDFLDGLTARLLKAGSAIGKELDSLADIVTFGIVPACIAQTLLIKTHADWLSYFYIATLPGFSFMTLFLVAAAAWRLARFNVDNTGYGYFKGLPTPAAALFFASLPLMMQQDVFANRFNFDVYSLDAFILNPYLLSAFIAVIACLMISKTPLMSFKTLSMRWQHFKWMYILIAISLLLFISFYWAAIPIILLLYVILSFFNRPKKIHEIQS